MPEYTQEGPHLERNSLAQTNSAQKVSIEVMAMS